MTYKIHPIFLIAVLAVATGCGSDDDSKSSDATAATTTAQSSAAPYGTYVRSMTKSDLARTAAIRDEAGPNQETPPTGSYRLVVAKGTSQDVIKAIDPSDFPIAQDVSFEGDEAKIGLLYWMGRALEAQGKGGDAIASYERAMAVDIRFMDLGERIRRLTAGRR